MKNKMYRFVFVSLLFFALINFPLSTLAITSEITQINFTTDPQTIDIDSLSSRLTTQTQNAAGASEPLDTSGTIIELNSSSATGVFYNSNATSCTTLLTAPFTLTMSNGSANKNFCYKDSTAGTHTLTITAQGKSWTAAVQSITVNPPPDTTAPTITLTGANPQTIEVHGSYSELGATVADNVDTNLTATIDTSAINLAVLGNYSIKYNAADAAGNAAVEVTRIVQVVDTTKPVITLTGSSTINSTVGDTYTEQGATVSDNYDTGLTATVGGDDVNTTAEGTYTITYDAVDSSGNAADQISRTVIYGPVPQSSGGVVSGGAVGGSMLPIVENTSSNSLTNEPVSTPTGPAPASTPAANSIQIPESSPDIALNTEITSKVETRTPKVFAKAEDAPQQNDELEKTSPEILTASAINALPTETPSNKIPLATVTLSGILLLFGAWKLKLFG